MSHQQDPSKYAPHGFKLCNHSVTLRHLSLPRLTSIAWTANLLMTSDETGARSHEFGGLQSHETQYLRGCEVYTTLGPVFGDDTMAATVMDDSYSSVANPNGSKTS